MPSLVSLGARMRFAGVLVLAASAALAQEVEVQLAPVRDTSVFNGTDDSATLSDGSGEFLWTSVTAGGLNRRALLKFDLAPIAPGAKVVSVSLSLYESRARDEHVVSLHRLLESWGEGASNGGSAGAGSPAQPGDATWTHRFVPSSQWTTPGGHFDGVASASISVGAPNTRYVWSGQRDGVTGAAPRIVQDVQAWVDTPAANHGWILIGQEAGLQNAKRFHSRENAVEKPLLLVRYQPAPPPADGDIPLPAWALGLLGAALAGSLMRRRRAQ